MIETIDGQVVELSDKEYQRHRDAAAHENPDERKAMEAQAELDAIDKATMLAMFSELFNRMDKRTKGLIKPAIRTKLAKLDENAIIKQRIYER